MTPGGVENEVRLQRTIRQGAFYLRISRYVTVHWRLGLKLKGFRGKKNPGSVSDCNMIAVQLRSIRRRAVRMARAAGEPTWRQTSRAVTAATPTASQPAPNSQAAAARAK